MEKKKQIVLHILNELKWYWDKAEELINMVNSTYCTNEVLDSLIDFIDEGIKSTKKDIQKRALEKTMLRLKKIKELEGKERCSDEELDRMLDEILDTI